MKSVRIYAVGNKDFIKVLHKCKALIYQKRDFILHSQQIRKWINQEYFHAFYTLAFDGDEC
jgi:hypothetical protein